MLEINKNINLLKVEVKYLLVTDNNVFCRLQVTNKKLYVKKKVNFLLSFILCCDVPFLINNLGVKVALLTSYYFKFGKNL